jgi:hypothetical protein
MRTLYLKDRQGKFRGSIANLRATRLTVPPIPKYPTPTIETSSASFVLENDAERWNLNTANDLGLPEVRRIYNSEREKTVAKKAALSVFATTQAGYISGVAALYASLGPSPVVVVISVIGLPITMALASLPAREYHLVNISSVATPSDTKTDFN